MEDEKVFHHSFGRLALTFLVVLFLGYAVFAIGKIDYFLVALFGFAFLGALHFASSIVKISNEGIITSRLLISKMMTWGEIARISTRGQTIRLHNRDENMVLSIDPQLDGYPEIAEIIFRRRPDLINATETTFFTAWSVSALIVGFGAFLVAVSVFLFLLTEQFEKILPLIFFALGIFIIVSWFLSPKRLAFENQTVNIKYLYKEVSYFAEDISSISLEKTRTKEGYIYFVQLNLKSGKRIKLPTFNQGAVVIYQILKRWHAKAVSESRVSFLAQSSLTDEAFPR